jgi:hypothetical protein
MSATTQDVGLVARVKTFMGIQVDGSSSSPSGYRVSLRNDQYVLNSVPTKALLAQEGSYFTANNAQSGLATAASPNAFSATNPFILLVNGASTTSNPVVVVPDYIALVATAAGTNGTNIQYAVTKDTTNRYTSGGTLLTPQKMYSGGPGSVVTTLYGGNITAASASANVATPVGQRYLMGAIPVVGDLYMLSFGAVDMTVSQGKQTINMVVQPLPPMVIYPGESLLFHLWLGSQTGASSYAPEIGWWEW